MSLLRMQEQREDPQENMGRCGWSRQWTISFAFTLSRLVKGTCSDNHILSWFYLSFPRTGKRHCASIRDLAELSTMTLSFLSVRIVIFKMFSTTSTCLFHRGSSLNRKKMGHIGNACTFLDRLLPFILMHRYQIICTLREFAEIKSTRPW